MLRGPKNVNAGNCSFWIFVEETPYRGWVYPIKAASRQHKAGSGVLIDENPPSLALCYKDHRKPTGGEISRAMDY
jgi:hypothetical protein